MTGSTRAGPHSTDHTVLSARWRWLVGGGLVAASLGYLLLPVSDLQDTYYVTVAALSVVAATAGVWIHTPRRRRIWAAFIGGMSCWVAGDAVWTYLSRVLHVDPFPSVADVLYLAGYPLVALGLVFLVRGRQPGRDRAAALDAAIIATGVGVVAAVFVIEPLVTDASQDALGRLVGTAYPIGDVLLVALLARLWTRPGRALRSFWFLLVSLACFLVSDIAYNVMLIANGGDVTADWVDALLLLGYAFVAMATLDPSVRDLSIPAPDRTEGLTPSRLAVLTVAAMLAPAALLLDGVLGHRLHWQIIGLGSIVLIGLVMTRVSGLLQRVQEQAAALTALARDDGLTGLPNRRTWDFELARVCSASHQDGEPLHVALLDLDHFKAFNDTYGHPTGDLLLQAATATWRAALPADAFLARYGGEEFALLFRGLDGAEAHAAVDRLRALTPLRQTFSAGIARWDGTEEPAAVLARADAALYEAKRSGRDRVLVSQGTHRIRPGGSQPTGPHSGT
jgi:diguanylate cyclase (GGDEF)-like protein